MPFLKNLTPHTQAVQSTFTVVAPLVYCEGQPRIYDTYAEADAHAMHLAKKHPGVEFKISEIYQIEIRASVVFGE